MAMPNVLTTFAAVNGSGRQYGDKYSCGNYVSFHFLFSRMRRHAVTPCASGSKKLTEFLMKIALIGRNKHFVSN